MSYYCDYNHDSRQWCIRISECQPEALPGYKPTPREAVDFSKQSYLRDINYYLNAIEPNWNAVRQLDKLLTNEPSLYELASSART